MSLHSSMSAAAIRTRIERDQTSEVTLTQAEIIAVKFECAIDMTKQVGFPDIQARGEMLVREYEIQLRGLAEFADEYAEAFHIEVEQADPRDEDQQAWDAFCADVEETNASTIANTKFGSRAWFAGIDPEEF